LVRVYNFISKQKGIEEEEEEIIDLLQGRLRIAYLLGTTLGPTLEIRTKKWPVPLKSYISESVAKKQDTTNYGAKYHYRFILPICVNK
jgi:hypothetical protein